MIETLVVAITAYLFTWPALAGIVILGAIFEHNGARSWAVFLGIVALLSAYFMFDVPFQTLVVIAVGYIAIGVAWSFWRYNVHVERAVAKLSEVLAEAHLRGNTATRYRADMLERIAPNNMVDTIVAWIIIWPLSMIENVLGDVVRMLRMLVNRVFKSVYHRIYSGAVNALPVLVDPDEQQ